MKGFIYSVLVVVYILGLTVVVVTVGFEEHVIQLSDLTKEVGVFLMKCFVVIHCVFEIAKSCGFFKE